MLMQGWAGGKAIYLASGSSVAVEQLAAVCALGVV